MRLVCDIEADNLYRDATKVHCIVAKDIDTGKVYRFFDQVIDNGAAWKHIEADGPVLNGVKLLSQADLVIGHNWINFDARLLKKLFNAPIKTAKITDTLVRSYLLYPARQRHPDCPPSKVTVAGRRMIGPHTLENYGYVLGRGKVEYEDWETFDAEMLRRCEGDVEITHLLYNMQEKDMEDWDWSQAETLEKNFAFVMAEQESYGWLMDIESLDSLLDELQDKMDNIYKEIKQLAGKQIKSDGEFKCVITKAGKPKALVEKWYNNLDIRPFLLEDIVGDFSRIKYVELNPESPVQRINHLLSIGWVPTQYNFKTDKSGKPVRGPDGNYIETSPKLTEDSVQGIRIGELMIEYIALSHKHKQANGWKERLNENGTISAGGITNGTNTGRVTHRNVVNVPKVGELYGEQLRSLFIARPGRTLLGVDLSALENKLMGHFTYVFDRGEYAKRLETEDPHNNTVDVVSKIGVPITRHQAKTINYAIGYGAQYKKVAKTLGISDSLGKKVFNLWWSDRGPMKKLKDTIEKSLEARGQMVNGRLKENAYIKGMDGRKIFVRSKHSLLNALIQNAGSVIHKTVCCEAYRQIKLQKIDADIVGNFHDEIQYEVNQKDLDRLKVIALQCIDYTTEKYNLKVPMAGDAQEGKTWAATH